MTSESGKSCPYCRSRDTMRVYGTAGQGVGNILRCDCGYSCHEYFSADDPQHDPRAPANRLYNPYGEGRSDEGFLREVFGGDR